MKRVLLALVGVTICAGAAAAAEGGTDAGRGRTVPYKLFSLADLGFVAKNWEDPTKPRYAIIGNQAEWQMAFEPVPGKTPMPPTPAVFQKAQLVAVSRVSEASGPADRVLVLKSLEVVDGEVVMAYSFIPPAPRGGPKVKNTLLLAIPAELQHNIRFIEETETAASRAAAAELEAAKAAGRVKPPALE